MGMFPERLKEIRKSKRMSQRELAQALSVSQQTIGSWEVGRSEPNTELLQKIATYFSVSVDYLLGGKDTNRAPKWASNDDVLELQDYLDSNVNMAFRGVTLNKEQKERVDQILTQVFWEELKKEKMQHGDDLDE